MLKNILTLDGAQQLSKKEQSSINGGGYDCGNGHGVHCSDGYCCGAFGYRENLYLLLIAYIFKL